MTPEPLYDQPISERIRESMTWEEAFWLHVAYDPDSDCWLWMGKRQDEYGVIYEPRNDNRRATHISLASQGIIVPKGLCAMHTCDNPPCVNYNHLIVGTYGDNNRDRAKKGRSATGDASPSRKHRDKRPRGEAHGMARYTTEQITYAKQLIDQGWLTLNEIAKITGISKYTLSKIKRGLQWTHL